MKRDDFFFLAGALAVFTPFFLFADLYRWYVEANRVYPYLMAFCKFAILATAGESLGLRLQKGRYNQSGFGLFSRAVVWGFLGIWIAAAMKLYAAGGPRFLEGLGISGVATAMSGGFSGIKLLGAFSISVWMNTTFAPIFMTCHKVTDAHILKNGGSPKALVTPLRFGALLSEIDWKKQWNFVFKKTIPLFWIPAHTVTFLLPSQWQVLFAALLGVVLGVLLSVAAVKQRN
ncbi:MAG: hypothetical protein FWD56_06455 [Bacteroidales bacterium]|nr:hypothetical protein [Bacteroidales bacterium]